MLTILSWNILQGGGSRIPGIIQKIKILRPSVCVLSEFRNNHSGDQIKLLLNGIGYKYQCTTHSNKNENSIAIASLFPFESELHNNADPLFSGNIVSAHFEAFSIMGVYLPHKKKHSLFQFINNLISTSGKLYIIAGDYNSGINRVDQLGDSFWYEDQMKALSENNYNDVFRNFHGDIKEYSWYSHQGNGFRYDHIYAHHDLFPIIKSCRYLHEWRLEKLSDHSPMFMELG